jgi:hypothetical protein
MFYHANNKVHLTLIKVHDKKANAFRTRFARKKYHNPFLSCTLNSNITSYSQFIVFCNTFTHKNSPLSITASFVLNTEGGKRKNLREFAICT